MTACVVCQDRDPEERSQACARCAGRLRSALSCERCGTPLVDVEWADVRAMGDLEPRRVLCAGRCPREGCGTTCPICRRPVGDIHSGACSPFVLSKLVDPCRVSTEDCKGVPA